ncbi:unnamed protein product, partial [Rangifer tarandus platyrhynchus]
MRELVTPERLTGDKQGYVSTTGASGPSAFLRLGGGTGDSTAKRNESAAHGSQEEKGPREESCHLCAMRLT